MADKSLKHYRFKQEKKKAELDRQIAEFNAMTRYTDEAYKIAKAFVESVVRWKEQNNDKTE